MTNSENIRVKIAEPNDWYYHVNKLEDEDPTAMPTFRHGTPKTFTFSIDGFAPNVAEPVAGCYFYMMYNFVVIEALWVLPTYRRQGLAREILNKIEVMARNAKCENILASSLSFQKGEAFMMGLGFEVLARVPDCPKGAELVYCRKHLTQSLNPSISHIDKTSRV
jgi:GNAT superfamily N-acetyltransferase